MVDYYFEPSKTEVMLTELAGLVVRGYYRDFVNSINIHSESTVLDYCSGSGIIASLIAKRLEKGSLVCADVSQSWLNRTMARNNRYSHITGVHLRNFNEPLGPRLFDRIVVHYVLHDFPTEYRIPILRHLAINLDAKGLLVIREPLRPRNGAHGISLHELINSIESAGGFKYDYSQDRKRIIGAYVDVRCSKDCYHTTLQRS